MLGYLFVWPVSDSRAADRIRRAGRKVSISTKRYVVEFDGLTMTRIENRLTGEVYAAPPAAQPHRAKAGLTIESLRPGMPNKLYTLSERTRLQAAKTPGGIALTYTGLEHGKEFDAGMVFTLKLSVDAKTGDLLIRPEVRAEIEQVIGVRDRGVLNCSVRFGPLAEDLRLIIPASDGFSVTKDNVPANWGYGNRWPQGWEAALIIAESKKGCLGLWADEPALRYGRSLNIKRDQGWNIALFFETADVIYRCTEMKGATWRFNVFAGYWAKAAERYVQQMEQQWPDLERLDKATPAWADKIRVMISGPTPDAKTAKRFAGLVPRDTIGVFTCQEWMKGWNSGAIRDRKVGMDYFPNWPLDNPTHYYAREDMPAKFKALEAMGIHIFPYTNPTIVTHGHPWIRHKIGPRKYFAYRFWQRMHPELCHEVVKTYGVSGIYEDCSWVVNRHHLGEPDGDNWYNGSVRMRKYFRKLMPNVAVMGERNNEVTFRGQKFALSITQWGNHAHPINAYIFGPFLRMWNLQLQPGGFDADDIRGWMTPWPFQFEDHPLQERLMLRKRGIVFAREQLESHWPDKWDPEVMHYLKSKDGAEYRFIRRNGTRFVKLTPKGEELIYWRLHGVTDAAVGKSGVQGWLGYDGNRIVGLNPKAVYITLDEVKRPPVTISSVPKGFAITRCLVRDGFWLATFDRLGKKTGKSAVGTIRVRSKGKNVSFCGAKSVKKLGKGEYQVQLALPGGLGAYWTKPGELDYGMELTEIAALNTVSRRGSGLISKHGRRFYRAAQINQSPGSTEAREEGSIAWLVQIPEFGVELEGKPYLVFKYGTTHEYGDGANYMVRVNGKTLWKRYRPQISKFTKADSKPQAPPIKTGAVNLKKFVGQVVILELAVDGNRTSVSETIRWDRPTLKPSAPQTAEMDDDKTAPEPGGFDLPLMD